MKTYTKYLSAVILMFAANANAAISLDNSISGTTTNDFESLSAGAVVGLLTQTGATYGEKFSGQALTINGGFDELSGSPSSSLTIEANASTTQNIGIDSTPVAGGNTIYGNSSSLKQGSLAVLLDSESDVFGFDVTDAFFGLGSFSIEFFANDGSSLDLINVASVTDSFYGFKVDSGASLIKGVSIFNNDIGGLEFDNFTYSLSPVASTGSGSTGSGSSSPVSVPSVISVVPEPSSYAMMLGGLGLVGFMAFRRKK